jgi:rod shape determining protein RodA
MSIPSISGRNVDLWMILLVLILCGIGVATIYSTLQGTEVSTESHLHLKQFFWIGLGLVAMVITAMITYKAYYVLAPIFYLLSLLSLGLLFFFGDRGAGANRWLHVGGLSWQPAEMTKVATIFMLAHYLSGRKASSGSIKSFLPALGIVALPVLLIIQQPDLGTSLVFMGVLVAMLYGAGMKPVDLFLMLSPALSVVCAFHLISWMIFILVLLVMLYRARPRLLTTAVIFIINFAVGIITPILWRGLHEYQQNRIMVFLDPGRDPLGAGYQVIQSKVALGSGGLFGKGFLQGTQTKLAFLPAQHTDFIFSAFGEQFGFLGSLLILLLFLLFIIRGLKAAQMARNRFASLIAMGAVAVFCFHVFVNAGVAMGIMPVTGLPLPFMSYGGSSMITNMILVGLLLNVRYRWQEY